MKQYEAVIKVMKANGGYATLGFLYQQALKIPGVKWETKTPFASIRRIVQNDRFFFKIKPGLWALKEYKNRLPADIFPQKREIPSQAEEFNHAYYQGLLAEIGNLKDFQTWVPSQDRAKKYLGKSLGDIPTIVDFYEFSYENLVRRAQTVDVVWFNERKMPNSFFEVEHSTDFQHALVKFVELQDFYASFFIVADKVRRKEFETKISYSAFREFAERTRFLTYDSVSDWHAKTYELALVEKRIY